MNNIYEILYRDKEHYVTIRDRTGNDYPKRKRLFKTKQLQRLVDKQKPDTDIYITKYPTSHVVETLIFDFDNEEKISEAYTNAKQLYNYLTHNGLNVIIVESGSKGYHVYIQVPPFNFNSEMMGFDGKKVFEYYCNNITGNLHYSRKGHGLNLTNLDTNNTMAGLNGNIRVIGSTHPKTGKKCEIILGEFIDPTDEYYMQNINFVHKCYIQAVNQFNNELNTLKLENQLPRTTNIDFNNFIDNNDLRQIIPEKFGGTVKEFKDYIMVNCFHHADSNPSMVVKKEFFYCKSCEYKGNIWTLFKNHDLDMGEFLVKSKRVKG